VDRTASTVQPTPKPRSIDPVMTLSVAPGSTTRLRTKAHAAPTNNDAAITRVTEVRRRFEVAGWSLGAVWVSVLMTVSLSQ
jgi:hypothetical protein